MTNAPFRNVKIRIIHHRRTKCRNAQCGVPKSVPTRRARFARSMPAAAGWVGLFVVGRQLLILLKVSNFDQTATKERMILHVRHAGAASRGPGS
jgi:hypothetical protein